MVRERCRLYLITPPRIDPDGYRGKLAEALDGGDIGALQLRLKEATDDQIRTAIETLMPEAVARGVPFILNDRPDLAAEMGCDGVHVGQSDASYADAREALGNDRIVGVTCHDSRHLAMEAGERGADYVAFGAFFPTSTKDAKARATTEILEWWSELFLLPSVAIGGITAGNCVSLARAGADFVAVVSAVWDHENGPAAAVAEFEKALENAPRQSVVGQFEILFL